MYCDDLAKPSRKPGAVGDRMMGQRAAMFSRRGVETGLHPKLGEKSTPSAERHRHQFHAWKLRPFGYAGKSGIGEYD